MRLQTNKQAVGRGVMCIDLLHMCSRLLHDSCTTASTQNRCPSCDKVQRIERTGVSGRSTSGCALTRALSQTPGSHTQRTILSELLQARYPVTAAIAAGARVHGLRAHRRAPTAFIARSELADLARAG